MSGLKTTALWTAPPYDDVRFEPLEGDRCGRYFVVSQDCTYEKQKWTLYTERGGFQEPEFGCQSVREMQRYLNEHGKELARATEPPTVTKMPKRRRRRDEPEEKSFTAQPPS